MCFSDVKSDTLDFLCFFKGVVCRVLLQKWGGETHTHTPIITESLDKKAHSMLFLSHPDNPAIVTHSQHFVSGVRSELAGNLYA